METFSEKDHLEELDSVAHEQVEQLTKDIEKERSAQSLANYATFDVQFQEMVKDWQNELRNTTTQRFFRYIEVDCDALKKQGKLKEDETILPIRVADKNIRREQPSYIAFVTQSRRSLIFRTKKSGLNSGKSSSNEQRLEEDFTQGMRYPGWELPIYAATDGAQTHGWDAVEVVFDDSKPLKIAIEHVGHDKLLFPIGSVDVQFSEYYARGYDVSGLQLRSWVEKFGFNAEQVKLLLDVDKDTGRRTTSLYRIWKIVFRDEGKIKVGWRCDLAQAQTPREGQQTSVSCTDWLKSPVDLYLGRQERRVTVVPPAPILDEIGQPMLDAVTGQPMMSPESQQEQVVDIPETEFPVYLLRYHMTEVQQIFATRGRVFLDRYDQDAQTAITSGFVNKLMRSTNVYAAVNGDTSPGSNSAPKQLPVQLQHGAIYDKPLNFFSADAPEAILLNALQYFNARNADENGQTDFAVNNRQDSRKTATEIQAATQQAGLLSGVQVTLYSAWLCAVYRRCWEAAQSMALLGKIPLLCLNEPMPDVYENDIEVLSQKYYVRAAGDIDVTQRAEQIQRMGQMWPIVANTPIAMEFLKEFMTVAFPLDGSRWTQALDMADQTKQLLATCAMMLEQLIMSRPDELAALPPEQQQQLAMLKQQVATVLNPEVANVK